MIDKFSIRKIMIDTSPFIYFIEEHEKYLAAIKPIFSKIDTNRIDAIQLASGISNRCDTFLTNDTQLKRVKEINVVTLDDLFGK